MNNRFCTRCGSLLGEDGTCPNCGTAYHIEGIFDEPQVFGNTYGTRSSDAVNAANSANFANTASPVYPVTEVEEVEEISDAQPRPADATYEYPEIEAEPVYSFAAPTVPEQNDVPQPESYSANTAYAAPEYAQPVQAVPEYAEPVQETREYAEPVYATPEYTVPDTAPQPQEPPAPKKKSGGVAEAVKDWLDCVITFFKEEPFAAVDKVLDGGIHLWAIFAGLNIVCGALCIAGMFGNGFVWLIDKVFGSYSMLISFYKEYTFGNLFVLFLFSLLMLALLFCAVTGCEYALFSLSKKKPRIEQLVRVVAISFFPMTIACAAAYLLSFFLMRVAAAILFAGAIASFRLLNESIRSEEGDLPFWNVVLCNVAQTVAAMIMVSISLAVI